MEKEKEHIEDFLILITGSRDFTDSAFINKKLDNALTVCKSGRLNLIIVHGGAKGADSIAGNWAKANGIETRVYPADWKTYGKRAGPLRNQQMLDEEKINYGYAFPLDGSIGTYDMINRLVKHNIKHKVFKYEKRNC